jgi:hypothetical protein
MDEETIETMRVIGLALGLLGTVIGCYSAWFELTKGTESPTSGYVALGVLGFALALGAGIVPLVVRGRLARAGVLMITLGALGYLASALASTRTLYFVALGCWVLGCGALLLASRRVSRRAQ